MSDAPPDAALNDARLALIAGSCRRLTGKSLLEVFGPLSMWNASRAIVAHGTEADLLFFYGNRLALQLFEMSFAEFVRLPSRLSVEPLRRETRALLMERVAGQGFVNDYSGVRISGGGRRFMIADATVWNLVDEAGVHHWQAATFIAGL